jgi:hypothetical protein
MGIALSGYADQIFYKAGKLTSLATALRFWSALPSPADEV